MANLKLDNSFKVNSITVTPEVEFIQDDLDIVLSLSASYGGKETIISGSLDAHPNKFSGYLKYRVTGSVLPAEEGQYIARTHQRINEGYYWELTDIEFISASFNWDDITSFRKGLVYSTDTAYVEGTDSLTITRYTG